MRSRAIIGVITLHNEFILPPLPNFSVTLDIVSGSRVLRAPLADSEPTCGMNNRLLKVHDLCVFKQEKVQKPHSVAICKDVC